MKNVESFLANTIVSLILLITITFGSAPAIAQSVVPGNGTLPTVTPVTINAGAGDQYDPHVSGDLVAYSSDLSIRYFYFSTNVDAQIPMGNSARDLLSDVSGSRIVFSRVIPADRTAVMVFDAATPTVPPVELDPMPGSTRIGNAIGGNTVAYIDFSLHGNGELVIYDLAGSGSVRITSDVAFDGNPSVSPDGTVVTWEHCATSSSNCDIWQAVRSGPVWNVSSSSSSANPEANPDTNGSLVVYDSVRASNPDLFWKTVTGGTEFQLQMLSVEANPSVVGNLISFESRPTLLSTSDMFVYDIVSNLLYQITNTPLVTEQLNDISVLPNGTIHVVWSSDEDGFDQRNIRGATFTLAPPADTIPPVFVQPSDIVADATLPTGAVVNFTVQASDNVGVTSLACAPRSGSMFPIGTTVVLCTAMDAAGNSAQATFDVRIKGAAEQIIDLAKFIETTNLPPALETNLKLILGVALISHRSGNDALSCRAMNFFILYVQSQPAGMIPPARKAQMIADANRIKAVLGCF